MFDNPPLTASHDAPATQGHAPVAATVATGSGWPTALRVRTAVCLMTGTGLVLVIAGSFLPWVVSGNVRRSSYAILGVVDRLGIADDGVIGLLIAGWPFVGVLCMTPVAAACVRWWRTAGVLAALIGLASGVLSFGILVAAGGAGGSTVRLDPIGPAVMAAGSVLLIGGGGALALGARSPVRRGARRLNANNSVTNSAIVQPND